MVNCVNPTIIESCFIKRSLKLIKRPWSATVRGRAEHGGQGLEYALQDVDNTEATMFRNSLVKDLAAVRSGFRQRRYPLFSWKYLYKNQRIRRYYYG